MINDQQSLDDQYLIVLHSWLIRYLPTKTSIACESYTKPKRDKLSDYFGNDPDLDI